MSTQTRIFTSSIQEFPVVRQSFDHGVDASANRSGKTLAQLKPMRLAYRICVRTMGVVECIVAYYRRSVLS